MTRIQAECMLRRQDRLLPRIAQQCRLTKAHIRRWKEHGREVPFTIVFLMQTDPLRISSTRRHEIRLIPRIRPVDQRIVRLFRKCCARRIIRLSNLCVRCPHQNKRLQENRMGAVFRADRPIRTVPCKACIVCRLRIVLKRIIAVHQMVFVESRVLSACTARKEELQIALRFSLDDARRVARMIERQAGRDHHLPRRIAAEIFYVFMNAAHKADVRCTAENALHLGTRPEERPRIHIDVDEMHNEAVKIRMCVVLLEQRAHTRIALLRKVLIGIGEDDPVPRRRIERKIFRCGKIIDPVEMEHTRAARTCNLHTLIRGARIDDNHLIGKTAHRAEPARKILRLVLDNDTR